MMNFLFTPVWCDDRDRRNRVQVPRWEWWMENIFPFILVAVLLTVVALFARWDNLR